MKKALSIFLLSYYLIGNFILPMGDFSVIADLKEMYHHCKTTEDKDLTPFDFVTDHLLNIDCLFDAHKSGDVQRPHTPKRHHHISQTLIAYQFIQPFEFSKSKISCHIIKEIKISSSKSNYAYTYLETLLRPPISC